MAVNLLRIINSTVYSVLTIVLFCFTLLTPADFIYQCWQNHQLTNIFIVAGVYVLTVLLGLLVYASRVYTIRTGLGAIPKAWIPVTKGEVGTRVQRLVDEGLRRSAVVAYQARPRNLHSEDHNEHTSNSHDNLRYKKPTHDEELSINTNRPPWGPIQHLGWSAPSSPDLPGLRYKRVIDELPHLIEAKAVSLAPSDPLVASANSVFGVDDGRYLHHHHHNNNNDQDNIPDPRVVEILQRPTAMGLREYVGHLTTLGLIKPPESGAEFLALYEQARFSPRPLVEDEFRQLMNVFASILRGMKAIDDNVLQMNVYDNGFNSSGTESFIGPSDEEGETDTLGSTSLHRQPSSVTMSSSSSSFANNNDNDNDGASSSLQSVHTAPMVQPSSSSVVGSSSSLRRSLRRAESTISQHSGGSVIRLVHPRGPDDLPYEIRY